MRRLVRRGRVREVYADQPGEVTRHVEVGSSRLREHKVVDLVHPARLRVGRRQGRNVYIQFGPEPSDDDLLTGQLDSAELARRMVDAYNAAQEGTSGR